MSGFDETIEKLRSEIEGHIATLKATEAWTQAEKIYRALGTIEELAGTSKTSLAELFGFSDASAVSVTQGEFMGMDALDAAKLYMEKKKAVASSLDEIIEAIQKGGAQSVGRESLSTKLSRSTWDVAKAPGQELYTLVKFLPHLKRGKKKPGQAESGNVTDADSASPVGNGE
jgi:hypothetical protein